MKSSLSFVLLLLSLLPAMAIAEQSPNATDPATSFEVQGDSLHPYYVVLAFVGFGADRLADPLAAEAMLEGLGLDKTDPLVDVLKAAFSEAGNSRSLTPPKGSSVDHDTYQMERRVARAQDVARIYSDLLTAWEEAGLDPDRLGLYLDKEIRPTLSLGGSGDGPSATDALVETAYDDAFAAHRRGARQ